MEGQQDGRKGEFVASDDRAPNDDAALVDRRSAIKKAAVAAATAGAVWSAPRIEGLSLVPDYAAAGSFTGSVDVNFDDFLGPGTTDWWGPAPGGGTQTKTFSTPGGPFSVSINGPQRADSGANIPVTLNFAMDPPFNRLAGGSFNFRGRNSTGPKNGPHPGGPLASYIGGLPLATNNPTGPSIPVSFTIPAGVNNVGPSPVSNTQWGDITFTFNFNS